MLKLENKLETAELNFANLFIEPSQMMQDEDYNKTPACPGTWHVIFSAVAET